MTKIKPKEQVSITEAAKTLGIHDNTCRDYCKDGTLAAKKGVNGRWLIDKSSVEKLLTKGK